MNVTVTEPMPDLHKAPRRRSQADARAIQVERTPPHSVEGEQGVLGCVLLSPNDCMGKCIEKFPAGPSVFYDLKHQVIYERMLEMFEKKEAIDVITLHQRLKDRNQLEAVGGLDYLAPLPDKVASSANLEFYTQIVLDKFTLRQVIWTCTETVARVYENTGDIGVLIDEFERDALSLRQAVSEGEQSPSKTLVHEAISEFEAMRQRQGALAGLSTGFPDLDKITWGLQSPDMIVIAARPSIGKTSLAMNIADYVAVELKQPVGVFSLEMSKKQLMMRMMCSRARVNMRNFREGHFSERDFPKIADAAGKLAAAPLHINDKGGINILELRAKARRMQQEHGIKLFAVDYLQLLHGYSRKSEMNRQQEIAEVSNGVKEMAKELNVPVIVLAQLSRELDKRKSSIPLMSDLKESGAIEQDADFVGLLYKPKDDDDDTTTTDQDAVAVNMAVAKQRSGPTGIVHFSFLKSFTRFELAAKIHPDDIPQ